MHKLTSLLISALLLLTTLIPIQATTNYDLTILFTHDLHDNLEPYEILIDNEIQSRGGFARLKTAIDQERHLDKDLIIVDAGDYSMGTLFQTIYSTHAPALRLMGDMDYDATTLGNHEFDFRPQGLADSLQSALKSGDHLPPIIASNTDFPNEINEGLKNLKTAFDDYGLKDYHILNKKGLKIGLIGLMGIEADSNAPKAEVKFPHMIEEAKRVVNLLQEDEDVDMIIALSHAGTDGKPGKSEDELLAKKVPEIDVIISGHSHTTLDEPIIINDTTIVSSGRYSENLGKLIVEENDDRWQVKSYDILPINNQYKEDEIMKEKIAKFKEAINEDYLDHFSYDYDEVLAYSPFNFTASNQLAQIQEEEPLGYFIGDAYRYAVEKAEGDDYIPVDIAVVPSGVIRDSFTQGDIKVHQAFRVSSLGIGKDNLSGYPLISVYLTGKELKTAAEVDASIQPLMSTAQLYMTGLRYDFNPNRIFLNKITHIEKFDNNSPSEIENDRLYRVVANLYTAQMLEVVEDLSKGLLSIVPKDLNGHRIEDFENHIIYNGDEELKEWIALSQYLESFPEEDGRPTIDRKYQDHQGLKVISQDKNITAILSSPNMFSVAIIGVILLIILLIGLALRWFMKRRKKK